MNSERMRVVLSIAAIILVSIILYMINEGTIARTTRDIAMVVVGHILSKYSGVYDFYFGSSDGSKQKTELHGRSDQSYNQGDINDA